MAGRNKLVLLVTLALLIVVGAGRAYFYLTDGFSIENIAGSVESDSRYNVPLTSTQRAEIAHILSNPFTYLGKGCQTYVFANDKYVLKFFKQKHLQLPFYWSLLPHSIAENIKCRREAKRDLLYGGCYLAFTEANDLTGIIALHLTNYDPIDQEVTLIDKLGFSHIINVGHFPFLIQKRGYPLKNSTFSKLDLDALVEALEARGLRDLDPALLQNVGYLDDKLFFMDVGQFARRP